MDINWNLAPEGTTHAVTDKFGEPFLCWGKVIGSNIYLWDVLLNKWYCSSLTLNRTNNDYCWIKAPEKEKDLWFVYPIDGNDRGYRGDIVCLHQNGTYSIQHSNFVGSKEVTDYSDDQKVKSAYQILVESGYTHWAPLDRLFGKEKSVDV